MTRNPLGSVEKGRNPTRPAPFRSLDMIIILFKQGINLISNNRYKHEKKDDGIRNLTGNEEAINLKIAKINNLLL